MDYIEMVKELHEEFLDTDLTFATIWNYQDRCNDGIEVQADTVDEHLPAVAHIVREYGLTPSEVKEPDEEVDIRPFPEWIKVRYTEVPPNSDAADLLFESGAWEDFMET